MLEVRPAVEADAGNACHGELDGQDRTLLAVRIVTGCSHNRAHRTVGEGLGVKPSRVQSGAVVPQADRVFLAHLPTPIRTKRIHLTYVVEHGLSKSTSNREASTY